MLANVSCKGFGFTRQGLPIRNPPSEPRERTHESVDEKERDRVKMQLKTGIKTFLGDKQGTNEERRSTEKSGQGQFWQDIRWELEMVNQ